MSEEISINILNKEDVTFSLELSTTIQELIEFLVESFCDHFSNVPRQNIVIKSQTQKILLPNQTLQSILSQEKSKKLNVEIQQQNIQQPQNQFASSYPQQVIDSGNNQRFNQTNQQFQVNQTNQGRTPVQPMQQGFGNFNQQQQFTKVNNFSQNPMNSQQLVNNFGQQQQQQQQQQWQQQQQVGFNQFANQTQTGQSQNIQSMQSQSQEISINFVYQSNQINCAIDTSTILEELLQAMKETLQITENVSLFYNNNPLLDLKKTLASQNLPNNCTIHLKPFQPINQTGFGQNLPYPPGPYGAMNQPVNQTSNSQSPQKQGSNQSNQQAMTSQAMGQGDIVKLQFEIEDGMIKRNCVLNCNTNQQLGQLKMAVLSYIGINSLEIADVDFYFGQTVFGGPKLAKTLYQLSVTKDHTTIRAKVRWIGG